MEQIADGVYLLNGFPKYSVNVYLIGDVLLDAGGRMDQGRILRQLQGHPVRAHALTHVHSDHQGSTQRVCETLDIPLWCPVNDSIAAESGDMSRQVPSPNHPIIRMLDFMMAGPGQAVSRRLQEGDDVAGFTVIDTPGHTPGHVAYWRERDRLLILGDVVFGMNPLTMRPGLNRAPGLFTLDPAQNDASTRKLAALQPETICFGHGPPLRDGSQLQEFVARLPS